MRNQSSILSPSCRIIYYRVDSGVEIPNCTDRIFNVLEFLESRSYITMTALGTKEDINSSPRINRAMRRRMRKAEAKKISDGPFMTMCPVNGGDEELIPFLDSPLEYLLTLYEVLSEYLSPFKEKIDSIKKGVPHTNLCKIVGMVRSPMQ